LPVSRPVFLHTPKVLNNLQAGNSADLFEPHVQVGISRLHAKGYRCKGINIAVIDTGCDCQHPALGKGFGAGFKIAKGYDFVGDAYNGSNLPQPDDNPCASCAVSTILPSFAHPTLTDVYTLFFLSQLHGTHIMGVLSANENHMGFRGVCPEATMSSYRVFGCEENTNDELVAAALLRAYKDGGWWKLIVSPRIILSITEGIVSDFEFKADVFSLSVGAPGGWAGGSIAAVVASRIAKRRAVIVSAGNLGEVRNTLYIHTEIMMDVDTPLHLRKACSSPHRHPPAPVRYR
jgi:subtilisin family serine protease